MPIFIRVWLPVPRGAAVLSVLPEITSVSKGHTLRYLCGSVTSHVWSTAVIIFCNNVMRNWSFVAARSFECLLALFACHCSPQMNLYFKKSGGDLRTEIEDMKKRELTFIWMWLPVPEGIVKYPGDSQSNNCFFLFYFLWLSSLQVFSE